MKPAPDVPKIPAELPVVLINSTSPADHPSVLPAEYEAGRAMATMLLEAGHRDIAVIGYFRPSMRRTRASR